MKKILYITFVAALVALTSCSEKVDPVGGDYLDAINITASVGEQIVGRSNPLGGENETAFNSGDVIAVAITESGATQDEVQYTFDGSTWSAASYLFWTANTLEYQAYHPVGAGISYTEFTLPKDQSSIAKIAAADYMKVEGTLINFDGSNTNSIVFERQCARIIVNIDSFGTQWSSPVITSLTITSGASSVAGGSTVDVTPYVSGDSYTALVIPTATAAATSLFLNITVKDGEDTKYLTYTGIPATEAGYSYTFNLTVGYDKVEILGDILVNDWTSGSTVISNSPTKSAPEVGFFLYDDYDYSETLAEGKTVIGIISNVEATYATAVSLDEIAEVAWSTIEDDAVECSYTTDAVSNMQIVYDHATLNGQTRFEYYPAMDWVDAKNLYTGDYSETYGVWALPTILDLINIKTNKDTILASIAELDNSSSDVITLYNYYWTSETSESNPPTASNDHIWASYYMIEKLSGQGAMDKIAELGAVAVISFTY